VYLVLCDAFILADDGPKSVRRPALIPGFEKVMDDIHVVHLNGAGEDGTALHDERFRAPPSKRDLTNTNAGYWIAASDPYAAHHAVTGELTAVGRTRFRRVALLTDGAAASRGSLPD
jgi:hypothetical protein